MPRNYIRMTEKGKWTAKSLEKAVQAVKEGISMRAAAKRNKIPFSTLQERIKKGTLHASKLGRRCDLPEDKEKILADHVKLLSKVSYDLTPVQLRRVAFEFAEHNGIEHRFNKQTRMAGRDWLVGFLSRHNISVRKPEATNINKITDFDRIEVTRFFSNLREVEKDNFKETNVLSEDETGVTTVQEPELIIAEATMVRATSDFEVTGTQPLNLDIPTERNFLVENRLQNPEDDSLCSSFQLSPKNPENVTEAGSSEQQSSVDDFVEMFLQNTCPIPSTSQEIRKKRREKHSESLTSSPIKIKLIKKRQKKKNNKK